MGKFESDIETIEKSGIFDKDWYLQQYPDVASCGLDPLAHYLRYGVWLHRDPGPKFETKYYLSNNPDVAKAGVNPLLHYLKNGIKEGRVASPIALSPGEYGEKIDIVIPVYNALDDVQKCLASVKNRTDGYQVRAFVINDGSAEETTQWLRTYCADSELFVLIEHPENRGYTKAVNTGLRASTAPYVITLNSDTIVTRGWLKGLVRCINSDARIGVAGPLSNAASWQNVPDLYDADKQFAINALPDGVSPDDMASMVAEASSRVYPRLPFVNGFCFMIRRELIERIGIMDEENFPIGYGEENDFCIRAGDAGYELAIADDCYVFHAKSKSFGHSKKKELSKNGSDALKRKHTEAKYSALVKRVKQTEPIDKVRLAVQQKMAEVRSGAAVMDVMSLRVLFLLPVKGGGGGAHSVVQEVTAMRRLGIRAKIAVKESDRVNILDMYQDIEDAHNTFIGFTSQNIVEISEEYDVVVATVFSSTALLKKITDINPHILPAYYVQDYEPMFFPAETENWQIARDSYSLIPNALLFAKTHWIANKVRQEHGVTVHKVEPSIDHDVYLPGVKPRDGKIHIAAMIRPQTPYRGAERTMRVLSRLDKTHSGRFVFHLFGCAENDPRFQCLQRDFDYENRGILKRPEVAALLARSDIFLDFSDYQAFGRTALEAMACGCTAMVPLHGGADEYALDDINALVVDTFNEDECFERLNSLLQDSNRLRRMQSASLLTASRYSVHAAAVSELHLFGRMLAQHRAQNPHISKPKLLLMPSRRKDGYPAGSGYVRVTLPYGNKIIRRHWQVAECPAQHLPEPGAAQLLVVQREAGDFTLAQLQACLPAWRAAGGRLVYEIDDDLLDAEGLKQRGYKADARLLADKVQWLTQNADAVTVSTPALQARFAAINPNTRLVPNRLDAELWRIGKPRLSGPGIFTRQEGDPIRIGYIGTPTHDQDLAVIAEAMRRIEQHYGSRVEIEVIGGFQNSTPLFGKRVGLPRHNDYPRFVDWLQRRVHWDIGVIPLADDAFNRSKSHLKFLEYSALGLPSVVSRVESYTGICRHEENALLVENTTVAWVQALQRLIEDESLRQRLANSAQSDLAAMHLLDISAAELVEHFAAMAARV